MTTTGPGHRTASLSPVSDLPPPPPSNPNSVPPPPPDNLAPPPGYVAYQGAPTPQGTLRRVSGLKTAITVLSIIVAIGTALSAVLMGTVEDAANDFLRGDISEDDFIADYAPLLVGQSIQGIGQLGLVVVSIIWLYRVAKNVRLFGRKTTWAPLWAVFGWVLPPLFFVIPFLMVREMWKASDPDSPYGSDSWKRSGESMAVIAWFLLYGVASTVLGLVQASTVFNQGFGGDTDTLAETVTDFGGLGMLTSLVTVLAAIAWILAVREITDRHVRLTGER